MIKKILIPILSLLFIIALAACQSNEEPIVAPTPEKSTQSQTTTRKKTKRFHPKQHL